MRTVTRYPPCGWTITSGFPPEEIHPVICCRDLHLWSASTSLRVLPDPSTGEDHRLRKSRSEECSGGSAACTAPALHVGTGDRVGHSASMRMGILMDPKQKRDLREDSDASVALR